jgi:nitric oxide reductase subunit C
MTLRARQLLIFCLVAAFCLQTWLIYADPTGRMTPLSEQATHGRALWLANNCQSCHQIYGFGGFLGPDLTNATGRLTEARLDTILTEGAGVMPAFNLADDERAAIARFLVEVDATGVGQLPPLFTFDAEQVLTGAIERVTGADTPLSPAESRGMSILLEQKCIGCHLPNTLAEKKGTDLTTLITKLGPEGVKAIVTVGIPPKGMPAFGFGTEDLDALVAFLRWMGTHEETIHESFAASSATTGTSTAVPWFEYSQ